MIEQFLADLLTYHYLQNALVTAVIIGITAGTIGCFIVLRGLSLMGDAISHAVLPGIAVSFMLGIHFFIGALVFGVMTSVLVTYIERNSRIKSDTSIGIAFSSFLALGVVLIGMTRSSTDLFHILFGNVLAVQDSDKWITLAVSAAVLLTVRLLYRNLLLTSFDPLMAKASGISVGFYHYLLMLLLTLVAVTSMQSVGTILIVAMLITPAATAYLYAKSLKQMIFLSAFLGAFSSVVGLAAGYMLNLSAGSSIVLTASVLFAGSFFLAPKQKKGKTPGEPAVHLVPEESAK